MENSAQEPQFPLNPKKHHSAKELYTNWFLGFLAASGYGQIITLTVIVPLVIIAILAVVWKLCLVLLSPGFQASCLSHMQHGDIFVKKQLNKQKQLSMAIVMLREDSVK